LYHCRGVQLDNVSNGYAFHVVRRLYREYLFIGSTSSTRTAGTRRCRWLPRASLPCPALPTHVCASVCVRAWADACVGLCGRYSTWTAVSFGISALPALRTALLRQLAATRCANRCAAWAHPPRGLNGLSPGTEWAHPVPCRICTTNRARPVPDLRRGLGMPAPSTSAWGLNGLTPQASPPGPNGLTHTAAERVHSL